MKETDPPDTPPTHTHTFLSGFYDCKMLHRDREGELGLIQEQKLRLCHSVMQQEVSFPSICKLLRPQYIQEVIL